MSSLLEALAPKDRRGSKPRCHLLTHGSQEAVAQRLTALTYPFATVSPSDQWMPQGFDDIAEATLPEADRLLPADVRTALKQWWLAVPSKTAMSPNWDIASTCTIDGRPGILIVEAKAHDRELIDQERGKRFDPSSASENSRRNHARIGSAIDEAGSALESDTGLRWSLSRDSHYQMSNRFAWAWKLANLGIPVVLIYAGFLEAAEMSDVGTPIPDAKAWWNIVTQHSERLFPAAVWNRKWLLNGQPFIPMVLAAKLPLQDEALE